ncbi:RagB/SusD family nutrient uptake outer membrane protein [Wenyingzhuangia sp. IMCC45574]
MKIYKSIKTSLLLLLAINIVSCSDDFLEHENPNYLEESLLYQTNTDMVTGLSAAYSSMRKEAAIGVIANAKRSDLTFPGGFRSAFTASSKPFHTHTYDNSNTEVNRKWAELYEGVFRANQVIAGYELIKANYTTEEEEEEGLRLLAEARALRGYFHMQIANAFNQGSVPKFNFSPVLISDLQQPLSTAEEVRNFYRNDLRYAVENLDPLQPANNAGRIGGNACKALLGKSYLYEYDYRNEGDARNQVAKDSAKFYFEDIINNGGYSLTQDINDNFTSLNEFNSESILEINYTVAVATSKDAGTEEALHNTISDNIGLGGFASAIVPSAWLLTTYREEMPDPADPINVVVDPDTARDTLRLFSERTSNSIAMFDDRYSSFYNAPRTAEQTPLVVDGVEVEAAVTLDNRIFDNVHWISNFKKQTNWNLGVRTDVAVTGDGRSGVNLRLIRLADVYLMYAECLLLEDNLEEARYYINKVRRRARVVLLGPRSTHAEFAAYTFSEELPGDYDYDGNPDDLLYDTKEELTNHLRYVERPLELAIEGNAIRFYDLRRWGVIRDRLQELSQKSFSLAGVPAGFNGRSVFRGEVLLYSHNASNPTPAGQVAFRGEFKTLEELNLNRVAHPGEGRSNFYDEFREANAFYTDDKEYFPIPVDEINSNQKIND